MMVNIWIAVVGTWFIGMVHLALHNAAVEDEHGNPIRKENKK